MLPLIQALGYRAPLWLHLRLQSLTVGLLVLANPRRCRAECTANYAFYTSLYLDVARWIAPLQQYMIFAPYKMNILAIAPCWQLCGVVNTSLSLFIGLLCPTIFLAALEEPIRLRFLSERGGTPLFSSTKTTLAYCLAMLPLYAVLVVALVSAVAILAAV